MPASLCLVALAVLSVQSVPGAPTARIDFPTTSTLTDETSIRLRGAASDADGVAAVSVNGVPASTVDGFAVWWADVPLSIGENALVVETLDTLGNLDPAAATALVRRDEVLLGDVGYVALDGSGERAWLLDQARYTPSNQQFARVLAVDLDDGSLSVVSSRDKGSGPLNSMFTGLGELEYDGFGERLVVVNAFPGELIAIDLSTGDRNVIAGPSLGSGPSLYQCWGLEVDARAPRAWVLRNDSAGQAMTGEVLEVDLPSGDRRVLASQSVAKWPTSFGQLALLADGARLAVAAENEITAIDLATGAQSTLADGSLAVGEPWTYLNALAFDPLGRGWTASWNVDRAFAFDPASGACAVALEDPLRATARYVDLAHDASRARLLALDEFNALLLARPDDGGPVEVVARNSIGSGPLVGAQKGLGFAYDGAGRACVVDRLRAEVITVDVDDGERRLVGGAGAGSGVALSHPEDAVFDDSGPAPRWIVLDREVGGLVAIDAASGARTLLSGPGAGAGVPFVMEHEIPLPLLNVERIGGTGWVLDFAPAWFERRLLSVDLASGDRTLVSGGGAGSGTPLVDGQDLALDPLRARALVATVNSILAIDLASGARSELSGPLAGSGPPLGGVQCIAWDAPADRLLSIDSAGVIIAVDGESGERTLIHKRTFGKGPGFFGGIQKVALLRPAPGAEPVLLYSDNGVFGIGVLDLQPEPGSDRVSGYHAILSR